MMQSRAEGHGLPDDRIQEVGNQHLPDIFCRNSQKSALKERAFDTEKVE